MSFCFGAFASDYFGTIPVTKIHGDTSDQSTCSSFVSFERHKRSLGLHTVSDIDNVFREMFAKCSSQT